METIIKVMNSLVKMNGWTVTRFDIQSFNYGHGIEGYVGNLYIEERTKVMIIRDTGSFEYRED